MANKLNFKISSALKDIIGRDLITDDYIAIFELVKNSYDAHASKVEIVFENIHKPESSKIIIIDNGKGMDYNDLIEKWLFVAYSAKKDGTEDLNYRDRIQRNIHYAGAKGIGRFSCDRLGKNLKLESTKIGSTRTEVLITNWEKFEDNLKDEFIDIEILHSSKSENSFGFGNGTFLEITDLRSNWDRIKILKLKAALAKLINPNIDNYEHTFSIKITCNDELINDNNETESYKIVNGEVENLIFGTLEVKTSKIESVISEDGLFQYTHLKDGGTTIYQIKENNQFKKLKNISCKLFYLNQSAKSTFTRRMGLPPVQYGHVFVYKNGFRVYPYGEPGQDPLQINLRKSQGYGRYLGTRELIGQIEIFGENEELKETTSREGIIKTSTYLQLELFFEESLKKLERYVVDVQKWGLSIEEDDSIDRINLITELIAKISGSKDILELNYGENFLQLLESSQSDSAEVIVKNLSRIAIESGNENIAIEAKKAYIKIHEINKARIEAQKQAELEFERARAATAELKEKVSENLFLKSINTSEFQEIIALLHHVGIYAGTIDNKLRNISLKIQNSMTVSKEDLNGIIRSISFEIKKILNVVAFATKANFKLKTEELEVDLNNYIQEYIQNIIPTIIDKSIDIRFISNVNRKHELKIKPIEINIIIDNIVSNSKKAGASKLDIVSYENDNELFCVKFIDDGLGIEDESIEKIFDFGYTTTDGSGLGLFHIKEILNSMKSKISAKNNIPLKGATFIIEFKG